MNRITIDDRENTRRLCPKSDFVEVRSLAKSEKLKGDKSHCGP
jgi:hypothetical protein